MGFEPMTCALRVRCSTTELPGRRCSGPGQVSLAAPGVVPPTILACRQQTLSRRVLKRALRDGVTQTLGQEGCESLSLKGVALLRKGDLFSGRR
jgi:hypothetical protein